jgi:hypothetical protein
MAWRPIARNAALGMSVYMNDTWEPPTVKWLYWRDKLLAVPCARTPPPQGATMTDDQLRAWASKASSEIVKREGAALALSARVIVTSPLSRPTAIYWA